MRIKITIDTDKLTVARLLAVQTAAKNINTLEQSDAQIALRKELKTRIDAKRYRAIAA